MCAQDRSAAFATAAEKGTELCGGRKLPHNAQSINRSNSPGKNVVYEEVPFILYRIQYLEVLDLCTYRVSFVVKASLCLCLSLCVSSIIHQVRSTWPYIPALRQLTPQLSPRGVSHTHTHTHALLSKSTVYFASVNCYSPELVATSDAHPVDYRITCWHTCIPNLQWRFTLHGRILELRIEHIKCAD